jgi:Ca2+-binding RTX toxin-like protein
VTSTTAPIHVVFRGLGGNDTLNGGSGNDSLFGGLGNDNLTGNGGTDMVIESRDRNMTLGNAQLNVDPAGINEIDTLATIERAKLTGGPGANTITAAGFTNGAVEINGGFGNDVLTGGDSTTEADTINGGPGSDNVNGGLGLLDIVKMEAEARGTTLTVVSANQATSQAMLGGMFETLATDTLANFEAVSLIGSPGNDSFRNDSPLTATLSGGAGNDTYLFANVTANTVVVVNEPVNAGTDTLNLSALTAAVTFNLTVQNATRATTGGFTLGIDLQDGAAGNGAANFENVVGSSTVANTLVGNAAANRLTGGAAADALTGNAGNDTLNGGTGDDRYLFAADSPLGTDTILEPGGASADVLDFLLTTTQNLVIDLNIPTAQTVCPNLMLVLGGNDTIEYVFGGSGNDSITGNGLNNSLTGGAGNDTLRGHSGTDSTINVSGTDTLAGDAGTDELTYDIPNVQNRPVTVNLGLSSATNDGFGTQDIVSGFEKLVGTRGSDLLEGDALANVIEGLNGRDTVRGLGGNDSLVGNRGEDVLEGGAGNDTLEGVGRKDRLYGGSRDSENNGTGNDCLLGGNGADTLLGGDGNDSYDGGVGDGDVCDDFDQNPLPGPQFLGCERGEP